MSLDRIVVGTDFSSPSLEATDWVVRRFAPGAEFVLVHAVYVPSPPSFLRGRFPGAETVRDDARVGGARRLADLRASLGAAHVTTEVRIGRPEDALHAVAEARRADLIVVGRGGEHQGVWGRLGGTAENLVRTGRTPVLLATGLHDEPPRRVLVALDDSFATVSVASWARRIAARHGAQLVALHVVSAGVPAHLLAAAGVGAHDEADSGESDRDAAERAEWRHDTDQWLERVVGADVPRDRVTSETTFGSPGPEILAAAERHGADLIVMGTHGAGAVRRALLGSVAGEVLHGARCAVLVVPPTTDEFDD